MAEHRLRILRIDTDDPVARLELNAWRGPDDDEIAQIVRRFETRSHCLVLVSDEIDARAKTAAAIIGGVQGLRRFGADLRHEIEAENHRVDEAFSFSSTRHVLNLNGPSSWRTLSQTDRAGRTRHMCATGATKRASGLFRLFCIVVSRLGPKMGDFPEGSSPALLRRAEHYLPVEWVRSAFEILPSGEVTEVPQGAFLQHLTKTFRHPIASATPDELSDFRERLPGL